MAGNADLQAPIINVQVMAGDSKAGFGEQRILIIAQGSGTNTPKQLIEDIQKNEVVELCGEGSLATRAYSRVRDFNRANEIDIITLQEPVDGLKAQGGFKITGTAGESKTLNIKVGDDTFLVSLVVTKDQTAENIAVSVRDAINAKDYPFTASIDGTDATLVLIDFDIKGEVANGITVVAKDRILGLTFTSVPFTGGAGAYDNEGMFDGLSKRYQTVLFDRATNFDLVETWLQSRINMSNTVKGGQGITMMNGTYSEVKDFCNNRNSQSITVIGNVDTMKFNALPILAVAEVGAIRALRLTDGAIIGSYVLDTVEAYGGINKSSLPYHNTPLSYDDPINKIEIEEVQDLNDAGVTLFIPATVGVVLGSVKTLYKYDLSGIEDKTFRYLNAMDTSLAIQEYLYANSQKKFGQTRATGGDLVEGVSMTNELSVKAYIVSLYSNLVDMALAQGGAEAIKAFKKNLTVTLDSASGTYSVYAPTPIVSQFRGMNMTVAISYDIES